MILRIASLAVALLFAAGVVSGIGLLAAAASKTVSIGIATVATLVIMNSFVSELPSATAFGLTAFPADFVATALVLSTLLRIHRHGLDRLQVWWMVFCCVLVTSLALGVLVEGLQPAVVQFRNHYYFLVAALYTSTALPFSTEERRTETIWLWMGAFLGVIALARWALPAAEWLGSWATGGPGGTPRPIVAAEALIVAQAGLVAMTSTRLRAITRVSVFGLLLGVVVAVQHRSVWIVTIVSLLLLTTSRAQRRRYLALGLGVGIVAAGAVLLLPEMTRTIGEPLERAGTQGGTWEWRVEGWEGLVGEQLRDPGTWVIGRPFGTPWDRRVGAEVVEVSPHNYYVEVLVRGGILAAGVLLIWAMILARRLASSTPGLSASKRWRWIVLLVGLAVYCIPYSPGFIQGVIVGLAIAMARNRRPPHTQRIGTVSIEGKSLPAHPSVSGPTTSRTM